MRGDKPFIIRAGRFRLKIWKSDFDFGIDSRCIALEYNYFDKKIEKWVPMYFRISLADIKRLKELIGKFESEKDELIKRGFYEK